MMTESFSSLSNTTSMPVKNITSDGNNIHVHTENKDMKFIIPKTHDLNTDEIKSVFLCDSVDGAITITSTHAIFMPQFGSNIEAVITKLSDIESIEINENEKTFTHTDDAENEFLVPSGKVFMMA